jgi:hypothetical protein
MYLKHCYWRNKDEVTSVTVLSVNCGSYSANSPSVSDRIVTNQAFIEVLPLTLHLPNTKHGNSN